MKLEKHQLVPYLLHHLMIKTTRRTESEKGKAMGYWTGELCDVDARDQITNPISVFDDDLGIIDFELKDCTPLLHPLSRLTEEQPTSILRIEEIVNESPYHCDAYDEWYEIFIDNPTAEKLLKAPYEIVQELFKQGYDVFGLIDQGLAEAIKSE